jgi:protein ImuB
MHAARRGTNHTRGRLRISDADLLQVPGRRFLAVHLPHFPTDRLRRLNRGLPPEQPLATWATAGNARQLCAVDQAAVAIGLHAGQALADAQAMSPGLQLAPADPEGDAEALYDLALWARRYTPLSAVDAPQGLLLDVTGCAHLLGGEPALLGDILARLHRAGIAGRGAISGGAMASS